MRMRNLAIAGGIQVFIPEGKVQRWRAKRVFCYGYAPFSLTKNKENVADEVRWIFSSPNSSEDLTF